MMIENFTADDARKMYEAKSDNAVNEVLNDIKSKAATEIFTYRKTLSPYVIDSLRKLKFQVTYLGSNGDSCYRISW